MAELQKDALMRRIQEACFAAHECALYLDGHPFNRKALEMHRRFTSDAESLKAEYEASYGPLTAENASVNRGEPEIWRWTMDKWPWQNTED